MLKRFTLLASSLLAALSIAAEETTATDAAASFDVKDGGKTLVVSGKGDLTRLETTITTTKFTNAAVGNVFVQNGESYVSVAEGAEFSATGTYYKEVPGEKKQIENTAEKPFLDNSAYVTKYSKGKYLKSEYVGKVFTSETNPSNVSSGWIADGTLVAADEEIKTDGSVYYYILNEAGVYEVMVRSIDNVKGQKANAISDMSSYYSEATKFTAAQTIYVSIDGGKSYTEIAEGTSAIYNESATYYMAGSTTYSEYPAKNLTESFTANNYIEKSITKTKSFSETLFDKIIENTTLSDKIYTGSYETVVFKNTGETDLIINDAIVRAILFPGDNGNFNGSIVTLDLGETTVNALGASTFQTAANQYYSCRAQHIIIPKTVKTSVLNEATKEYVEKMVVPTQLFENYGTSEYLKEITIPEGYDRLAEKAFYTNAKITTFNLPSTLKLIGESAFENCAALASITLNKGLENIGKRAFVGTALTKIDFPSTLRIINDAAFANLRIEDLKFNAGLYYIGNTAFGLNNAIQGLKSIQIPASVKFIGACAFYGREYQDVYFLGENAPIMPMGGSVVINDAAKTNTAFPANTLNGNNGFNPGTEGQMPTADNMMDDAKNGYANRENYKNQGYYFAILHFPTGLTDEQREKYTDITRVYKTGRNADGSFTFDSSGGYVVGLEETDGHQFGTCTAYKKVAYGYEDTYLGKQYIWPSQSQWNRSYVVNSEGYNWDGVTKYRPTLSEEDMQVLAYAGYNLATEDHPSTEEGYYSLDDLQKIAHMGTRQFVLTNADTQKDEKPEEEPEYPISVKGSNWWTICLPFNMTKKQVDEVFGKGTHVCRFSSVSRTDDGNGNKSITLRFQNDVYATKWTRNAESLAYTKENGSPADNDIVIYSHEAYMIYPRKSEADAITLVRKDYTFDPGSPLPTIIQANAGTNSKDHTEYRFVGNYVTQVSVDKETSADKGVAPAAYETVTIPQYSYVYAKKKNDTTYKFWFYTGKTSGWAANKCVVQATARDGGTTDYNNFFGGNANSTKVTQMSLFGEETDGETTGVNEEITIIAGEGDKAQRVYNLNGQMIGTSNVSASHKGIYIKDGKKYIRR